MGPVKQRLRSIATRIEGKWQIPLFLLSTLAAVGAFLLVSNQDPVAEFHKDLERMEQLRSGGFLGEASELGRDLLSRTRVPESEKPAVRVLLAQSLSEIVHNSGYCASETAAEIAKEYQRAAQGGYELTSADYAFLGEVHDTAHQPELGVRNYQAAIERGALDPLSIRQRILVLQAEKLSAPAEALEQGYKEFAADASRRPELLLWSVEKYGAMLTEAGREEEAIAWIESQRPFFEQTDLREGFEYVLAHLEYTARHYLNAEMRLRGIRDRYDIRDLLSAKTAWLLGRTVMWDEGPQRPSEALAYFNEALANDLAGPYRQAAYLGLAEALADLERHAECLDAYRQAIARAAQDRGKGPVDEPDVRASLITLSDRLRRTGLNREALDCLLLADPLVSASDKQFRTFYLHQLAQTQQSLATEQQRRAQSLAGAAGQPNEADLHASQSLEQEAQKLLVDAAKALEEVADLNTLQEQDTAEALWTATGFYERAGDQRKVISLLMKFIQHRSTDAHVPEALYKLGRAHQALGEYDKAVESFRRNQVEFFSAPAALASLVPLADCYMALGGENNKLAEDVLLLMVDGDPSVPPVLTPRAPEFRDALFRLGDLYEEMEEHEKAVARLEEAVKRYPDDERVEGALFQLACAYRLSAYGLEDEISDAANIPNRDELRRERIRRLDRARQLYADVMDRLGRRPMESLAPLNHFHRRLALLYSADCLYDSGRFAEALPLYQEAAWKFQNLPDALGAYVQIINCNMILGHEAEARTAIERALWLAKKMPGAAFVDPPYDENSDDWIRYLTWLNSVDFL